MTSIQAIKVQPAFTSRKNVNNNQYTGLKTGAAYTAVAGASAYGIKKAIDPFTKFIIKNSRKTIADANDGLKNVRETMDLAKNAGDDVLLDMTKKLSESYKDLKNSTYKNASEMFKLRKGVKKLSMLKSFGMGVPFMLGMGLLTDILNNKQRKSIEPNATTKNGNEYTKVNMGKRIGLLNGTFVGVVSSLLNAKALKATGATNVTKAVSIGVSAIGGFVLGAIADKLANKQTAKAADRANA